MREPEREVYIAILVPPGYECVVAMLANFALGAVLPAEAKYFLTLCPPYMLITTGNHSDLEHYVEGELGARALTIDTILSRYPFALHCQEPEHLQSEIRFEVEDKEPLDLEKSVFVLFTSGTTGPPKRCRTFPLKYLSSKPMNTRRLGHKFSRRMVALHANALEYGPGIDAQCRACRSPPRTL